MSGDAARSVDPEFPNLPPEVVEGYRNAPETMVAEIIDGELSLLPRPRLGHANAATELGSALRSGFGRRGGGWVILAEPEVRLGPKPDVVVPDLAGWRRERVPPGFLEEAHATLAPDWVCEVLSPSTEGTDRGAKLDLYHREGVGHVWLLSRTLRSLEVFRRADIGWLLVNVHRGDARVRAEPFDAVELDLAGLWTL